jgi:hypothetical protein
VSSLAELVDRELNDEELHKVSGKEDIRRKLASLLKAATAEDEEDMKRTSSTAASAQETTRTKVGGHLRLLLSGFFKARYRNPFVFFYLID